MKLSNKILLGFFGAAFLYLTAAFAELRLTGVPNVISDKNSIAETVDLAGVSHVVLSNIEDRNIKIVGSDKPRLEVRSMEGNVLRAVTYNISGDTLTLSGVKPENNRMIKITVFVSESNLKRLTVNDASASIEGLEQDALTISQNSGRVWMSEVTVASLQLDLSNHSSIDLSGAHVGTVSANLDDSHAVIFTPLELLEGSLENNSTMRLSTLSEIQLKKDESSRLSIYQ